MAGYGFWSDPNTEPKRSFRWLLYIGGIPQWMMKDCKKPSYEITEIPHAYLNHTFHYPGRMKWAPVDISLVDPLTPDASATIMGIVQASGYAFPTSPDQTTTISKARAVAALGNVKIVQLDADGNEAEIWILRNAWISKVDFGELKYEADEMVNIKLTLVFDYAEISTIGSVVPPANQ